jgi:hypothetical protein
MTNERLIVFVKNLIPGTVKTRLADEIGADLAMEVYKQLVENTSDISDKVKVDRAVYYSEYVELYDFFHEDKYSKHLQEGNDLGQRMVNAFFDAFEEGYEKAVLIGSDIPNINKKIIDQAFAELDDHDITVGPAEDGGYYLLGMKKGNPSLFENKTYSHGNVLNELLEAAKEAELSVFQLEELVDLDTKEDFKKAGVEIVIEDEEGDQQERLY